MTKNKFQYFNFYDEKNWKEIIKIISKKFQLFSPKNVDQQIFLTMYCIEGTEMRQLGFKVRRLLFLNRY